MELAFGNSIKIDNIGSSVIIEAEGEKRVVLFHAYHEFSYTIHKYSNSVIDLLTNILSDLYKTLKHLKENFYGKLIDLYNMEEADYEYKVSECDVVEFDSVYLAAKKYSWNYVIRNIVGIEKLLKGKRIDHTGPFHIFVIFLETRKRGSEKRFKFIYRNKFEPIGYDRLSDYEKYVIDNFLNRLNDLTKGRVSVKVFKWRIPYREDMIIEENM